MMWKANADRGLTVMKKDHRPKTVGWWEPRWSFAPKNLREFRRALAPKACLHIAIAAAIATVALYIVVELTLRPAMPALQFNWPKAFAQSVAAIAACLAVFLGLSVTVPDYISVSSKRILIQQGGHAEAFKHGDIKAVHRVFRSNDRHFIRVETGTTCRRIGLSPKVSVNALAELLGDKIVIHDRRRNAVQSHDP